MVTYIGSKRISSVSDYSKLSTSEKVIASKSPEIKKILTGQKTTSQQLTELKKTGSTTGPAGNITIVPKGTDISAMIKQQNQANYAFLAQAQEQMLTAWQQKYAAAGITPGYSTGAAAFPVSEVPSQSVSLSPLWLLAGAAALMVLK